MKASTSLLLGGFLSLFCWSFAGAEEVPVDFLTQVKPLLQQRCVNCHHSGAMMGELSFESRKLAFKKRKDGPVILPGRPESSLMYLVLKLPAKNPKAMPAAGHRVDDKTIRLIYDWIKQGAVWPKGSAGVVQPNAEKPNES